MKSNPVMFAAGLFAPLALGAAGCAHAPPPAPVEDTHTQTVAAKPPPPVAAAPAPAQDPDVEAMLRGDVLHFGFDQAELTDESRTRLQHVADVMKQHGTVALTISGNTDERGTEEYNLALGQRRAEVARKYLVALGIEGARVKTVSYGKEKPAEAGHDEGSYQANRRDEVSVNHD